MRQLIACASAYLVSDVFIKTNTQYIAKIWSFNHLSQKKTYRESLND